MRTFVALGSNLGDRLAHLRAGSEGVAALDGVEAVRASSVYESEAHTLSGGEEAPAYLNAVVEVKTRLAPEELLEALLAIESGLGRERTRRWAPRTLDLDLLAHGQATCDTERLTLPHPRLAERRFVLQPWADLAPDFHVSEPFEATVADLLARCPDGTALAQTALRLR